MVSERITGIAEAGEDCRQVVRRSHDKMEVFEDIVAQLNAKAGINKDKSK